MDFLGAGDVLDDADPFGAAASARGAAHPVSGAAARAASAVSEARREIATEILFECLQLDSTVPEAVRPAAEAPVTVSVVSKRVERARQDRRRVAPIAAVVLAT
ncbi:hypothetical protein GCM10010271_73800 [Streptomyces kurssanovii]|nr:hypothetical protein GCM10010271_73800 [Streptomyces kurssanovii]